MAYVVRVTMVLSIFFAGIVLPGANAQARSVCHCPLMSTAERVDDVDTVFSGEVVRAKHVPRNMIPGNTMYTISVDQVFKGRVGVQTDVMTRNIDFGCGNGIPRKGPVLIYADVPQGDPPRALVMPPCSGSRAMTTLPVGLGEGHPPIGAKPALTSQLTVEHEDDGSTWAWVVVAGGLVVLLAAGLGFAVWRRRPNRD